MRNLLVFSIICLFIVVLVWSGCAGNLNNQENNFVQGKIYLTGSEPLTRLALENADGVYFLECSEKIKKELWALQQQIVRLYYSKKGMDMNYPLLTVDRFELLKEQ